jgi:hypothetical protein
MTNDWTLRDDILAATHHWQRIVAFCLLGALLGWGVSWLWPSPSRATQELYVGLNVYQAAQDRNAAEQAGIVFSNINDYKNWQMASLNTIIYTDSILDETLEQLRATDPYWQSIRRGELAAMLHVYWRNAGKWRLVAEHRDSRRAVQAVVAWQEVVVNRVNAAIQEARNAILIDQQLQAIATQQAHSATRLAALAQAQAELSAWQEHIAAAAPGQPLPEMQRNALAQLLALASPVQDDTSGQSLRLDLPASDAPASAYPAWIEQASLLVAQETRVTQAQEDASQKDLQSLTDRYSQAVQNSLGLSAEFKIDRINDAQPEQNAVRPASTLILVGAILGWIAWFLVWLIQANARAKQ